MTPEQIELGLLNANNWIGTLPANDAAFLRQLITQESGGRHDVTSSAGAAGLGQIIPERWADISTWLKRGNIPVDQWPPGVTPDNIDSFSTMSKRPLANTFMTYANMQMNREQALKYYNDKRPVGQKYGTLLDAVDGDPRKEAMVLAFGHKDGPARMKLLVGNGGQFDFEPALQFYEGRNARHQEKIDAALAKGNIGLVERLGRQDSHGHVFGYADRLGTAVGAGNNLPPLDINTDIVQRMANVRQSTHTADNPAVRGFIDRGANIDGASQSASATNTSPVSTPISDLESDNLLQSFLNRIFPSTALANGELGQVADNRPSNAELLSPKAKEERRINREDVLPLPRNLPEREGRSPVDTFREVPNGTTLQRLINDTVPDAKDLYRDLVNPDRASLTPQQLNDQQVIDSVTADLNNNQIPDILEDGADTFADSDIDNLLSGTVGNLDFDDGVESEFVLDEADPSAGRVVGETARAVIPKTEQLSAAKELLTEQGGEVADNVSSTGRELGGAARAGIDLLDDRAERIGESAQARLAEQEELRNREALQKQLDFAELQLNNLDSRIDATRAGAGRPFDFIQDAIEGFRELPDTSEERALELEASRPLLEQRIQELRDTLNFQDEAALQAADQRLIDQVLAEQQRTAELANRPDPNAVPAPPPEPEETPQQKAIKSLGIGDPGIFTPAEEGEAPVPTVAGTFEDGARSWIEGAPILDPSGQPYADPALQAIFTVKSDGTPDIDLGSTNTFVKNYRSGRPTAEEYGRAKQTDFQREQYDKEFHQPFLEDVDRGISRRVGRGVEDVLIDSFAPSVFDNSQALANIAGFNESTLNPTNLDSVAGNLLKLATDVPDNSSQLLEGFNEFQELREGVASGAFQRKSENEASIRLGDQLEAQGINPAAFEFDPRFNFDTNQARVDFDRVTSELQQQENILFEADAAARIMEQFAQDDPEFFKIERNSKFYNELLEISKQSQRLLEANRGSRPTFITGGRQP